MDENGAKKVYEELSSLIVLNTSYNKSIEIVDSLDPSIFDRLANLLDKDRNSFAWKDENFSTWLLFLLEHIPVVIDLHALLSTDVDYSPSTATTKKTHRVNLLPSKSNTIQYSTESQHLLELLYKKLRVKNLQELLLVEHGGHPIYQHCLDLLTPFLLKTTYDQHPIAVQVFVHLIKSMRQSSLSETFDFIFPVCLMTLDDPSIEMKFISLDLLDHLQRHCTTTELSLFNRSNVIMYKAFALFLDEHIVRDICIPVVYLGSDSNKIFIGVVIESSFSNLFSAHPFVGYVFWRMRAIPVNISSCEQVNWW